MKIKDKIKNFIKPKLVHTNKIQISKENILENIKLIKSIQPSAEIFPVLKSNAYWHWLKEISQILDETDISMIAVDSFPEYQIVNKYTDKKILILWETIKENYINFDFKTASFCVYNKDTINYLTSLNKKINIHLFLNTWMNREGIQEENLTQILKIIKKSKLNIEWVCSHFSNADEIDFSISQMQIDNFKQMHKKIEKAWFKPKYKHIWASAWLMKIQDDFFTAYRPWLIVYWYNPLDKKDKDYKKLLWLKPALELFSTIVSIQNVKTWEWVSYTKSFISKKDTKVWMIPFWYFEWLPRNLSNNWKVLINDCYYNQVWNMCMNLACINIDEKVKLQDNVKIISNNIKDKNNLYELAKKSETVTREVLTRLNSSVHREII